jgi:cyclic pyranopterin phosphate synthase
LVVAEGKSPRRGLGNSTIRPTSTSRLGQAVPLHLLQSNLPSYFGARFYSSSTSSSPPQSSDEQIAEEIQTNATPSPIPTAADGSEAGFASLRGLFGEPRRSWSPSQASSRETDAVDNAQSNRPEQASIEATFRSQQISRSTRAPKPKPLPLWKFDSDDFKGSPHSNEPVFRSVLSESAGPRRPVQAHTPSLTSQAPENVEPSPYDQKPPTLSEVPSSGHDSKLKTDTGLTHLTSAGEAHMVDVGQKESTDRVAVAVGFVHFSNDKPYRLIEQNSNKKGDVLGVARIAGIMAAKRCSDIIPLCHPIPITKVTLDVQHIKPYDAAHIWFLRGGAPTKYGVVAVEARVHTRGQTGVEMEALTAVTGACLTVYDMCKAVDKQMVISGARVLYKAGGKSGTYLHGQFKDHPIKEKFIKPDGNS